MTINTTNNSNHEEIYLSIDHLKDGRYKLHILLENKVVKSITIEKS